MNLELSGELNTIEVVQPRTKRQKDVLDYVTRFIERNGHKPSYQQIAMHLGVSSRAGIQRHIEALESQGLIRRRRADGSFGIELGVEKIVNDRVCGVELFEIGEDGRRCPAKIGETITIPRMMIGELSPDLVFALRAPDDSMIEEQICEGDFVLFEARSYARRGQVVTAETDAGRVLLGRYHQRGSETEITPANSGAEAYVLPADEVTVRGVFIGLLRFPALEEV
ncbi:MAG: transcriptional repressor LexA [Pyrinomonadaceae bacterium]